MSLLKSYYDSSQGLVKLNNTCSELFKIGCGVKQGGIISPYLFNAFIDDLIMECTQMNIGGLVGSLNVSIIVYADDIILISPSNDQLQRLLNACAEYGNKWKIKFNPSKSIVVSFGSGISNKFYLNDLKLKKEKSFKYLGVVFDEKMNTSNNFKDKMKLTQKSIFYLKFLGISSINVCPILQSCIYKSLCISKFKYGLESCYLKKKFRDEFNLSQNKIIRTFVRVGKYNHITRITRMLKLFSIEQLYIHAKLCFLTAIKLNQITMKIWATITSETNKRINKSESFLNDIILMEKYFNSNINDIFKNPNIYKNHLKTAFEARDGIDDSIRTCLYNYDSPLYRIHLKNLTKTEFYSNN